MLEGWHSLLRGILDQPLLLCDITNNSIIRANKLNIFLIRRSRRVYSDEEKANFLFMLLPNVNIDLNILITYPKNDVVFHVRFGSV